MELLDQISKFISDNVPSFIATSGNILAILISIVLMIRKATEMLGIGNNLVNNVVDAFNSKIDNQLDKIMGSFKIFTEQIFNEVSDLKDDINSLCEIVSTITLSKSLPASTKKEVMSMAANMKNKNLGKKISDLANVEPLLKETIKLAEVKEVIPLTATNNLNNHSNLNSKSTSTYIPTSE